jgi:hypothetical protein
MTLGKKLVRHPCGAVTKLDYVLKNGVGKIDIKSNPSAASITLGGKDQKEKTPATLSFITAGKHILTLASPPCAKGSVEVEVFHEQTAQINLELAGANASVYEGVCLSEPEIFLREEKKRLKAEKIQREKEEKLRLEEVARKLELKQQNQAKIQLLLAEARLGLENAQLEPLEGKNVFDKYQEVLGFDPENREAKAGLLRVGVQYVQMAEAAIGKADWTKTKEYLKKAGLANPGLATIVEVRSKFIKAREEAENRTPRSGYEWQDPKTGMEFVWIHGGCFAMGSLSGSSDERPVHE